jgi:hypothetical protein
MDTTFTHSHDRLGCLHFFLSLTTADFAISESDGSTFLFVDLASRRVYLHPGSFCSGFTTAVGIKSRRFECCNIVDLSRLERLPTQTTHSIPTRRRACSGIELKNGTLCGLGARYPHLQVFPSLVSPNALSNYLTSLDILQTVKPLRTSLDLHPIC